MTTHLRLQDPTVEQEYQLSRALLSAFPGREFDGMQAAVTMRDRFGVDADWHFWTYVMSDMASTKDAVCTQGWGMTKYRIGGIK